MGVKRSLCEIRTLITSVCTQNFQNHVM